jgi:hypothetical protein
MKSDGSTAKYYELPKGCTELQDLIGHRNMNAQIGEIFRACYRFGQADHSDLLRDAKKIRFYANAEVERLEVEAAAFTTALDGPENESVESFRERSIGEVVKYAGQPQQWADAPKWAHWLAQDETGYWYWYEDEPKDSGDITKWIAVENNFILAAVGNKNPNWKSTLQKRPATKDDWIDWAGGECPLPDGTICEIMFSDGCTVGLSALNNLRWIRTGAAGDIIKYRTTETPCQA